ncbi:MAG: FAD-binding oxidoreductase [Gemmatimonadaceae bacterium]|nr:FAD-binding oxidoreductase [Gemmatimonadaceae bacterium]
MSTHRADVVICGAGIAGIAAAHALATQYGVHNVVLVDERAPLTLTSDKSTEAYRTWWPGPDAAMVQLMNRSIDLLEQWSDASNDRFLMNRRGYLYATTDAANIPLWRTQAAIASAQGAGAVREVRSVHDLTSYQPSAHTGFRDHPDGADLFVDRDAIAQAFPFLADTIVAVLHARRCGWVSAQQLGMWLFDEARAAGVRFLSGRVNAVETKGGVVSRVTVATAAGATDHIDTPVFVNCAGPFAQQVGRLVGVELPLFSEMHLKIAFEDTLDAVDRNTGLVILDDAQQLPWTDEERAELAADPTTAWLTRPMPAGIHLRPEGYRNSKTVLMLWDYHSAHRYAEPVFPLEDDPVYAEVVMRGMVQLVPALAPYVERLPHAYIDGGYYTKTIENRPLIGPLPLQGAYVSAAFSGYGVMAAPAAGEILAAQITGSSQPSYAEAFLPDRYESAAYQERLRSWGGTGQL